MLSIRRDKLTVTYKPSMMLRYEAETQTIRRSTGRSELYPDTGQAVTQRDIAERCGISQVAVSLALRDDPSMSRETIAVVRAVAAELGYNPAQNDSARRLIAPAWHAGAQ